MFKTGNYTYWKWMRNWWNMFNRVQTCSKWSTYLLSKTIKGYKKVHSARRFTVNHCNWMNRRSGCWSSFLQSHKLGWLMAHSWTWTIFYTLQHVFLDRLYMNIVCILCILYIISADPGCARGSAKRKRIFWLLVLLLLFSDTTTTTTTIFWHNYYYYFLTQLLLLLLLLLLLAAYQKSRFF